MSTRIKTGLVSVTFRKLSVGEIIGLVQQAGLSAIEWGGDIHVPHGDVAKAKDAMKQTRDAGLAVAAYGSYYRIIRSEEDGLPFERVLECAVALGAPTLRVWAGTISAAVADLEYRGRVAAEARRIADLAGRAGLTISFESHGGTLTDAHESAVRLLKDVNHPNVRTHWQPLNGVPMGPNLAGLRELLPWLSNVHVFHWWPTHLDRHPLADGRENWLPYLAAVAADPKDRYALLEFVRGEEPDQFLRDAATLKHWLDGLP